MAQDYSENHYYRVVITEVDNGTEKVMHDEKHGGLYALMDSVDGKSFKELVLNDSLGHMATKIADSKHMKQAAKLATMFGMFDKANGESEKE